MDTIDFDLTCVRCDYNLRGMSAGAACPECGHRILDSIAEHLRRRTPLRVEHARFAERSPAALRSIRDAGLYAVVANGIAALWLVVHPSMFGRRTPGRYVLLGLLCVAIACAAMSIWRLAVPPHRPSRWALAGRSLVRAGAVASLLYVAHMTFTRDYVFNGYRILWPGATSDYASVALAWTTALGIALRLAYAQWWLRLEGKSLIAWPLMLCGIPVIFWYAFISLDGYWYRGNFVSLEYFTESPLASNAWPIFYAEGTRELLHAGPWGAFIFCLFLLGHALIIVGDATLAWLARRALRITSANTSPASPARTPAAGRRTSP